MAEPIARAIVRRIEADLREQPGLGYAWDSLGEDVQRRMLDGWAHIADAEIKAGVLRLLDGQPPEILPYPGEARRGQRV